MDEPSSSAGRGAVTRVLQSAARGDGHAAEELLPLVYAELRTLARARLARLGPGQTIQSTALVHEAWLRLVGEDDPGWNSRAHFFGAAAQAMREILVDHARAKASRKRGGDRERTGELHIAELSCDGPDDRLLIVDEALSQLQEDHPRRVQVVMLRFFAGLSSDEVARVQGVTRRTVERDWRFAQAWLLRALSESDGGGSA